MKRIEFWKSKLSEKYSNIFARLIFDLQKAQKEEDKHSEIDREVEENQEESIWDDEVEQNPEYTPPSVKNKLSGVQTRDHSANTLQWIEIDNSDSEGWLPKKHIGAVPNPRPVQEISNFTISKSNKTEKRSIESEIVDGLIEKFYLRRKSAYPGKKPR